VVGVAEAVGEPVDDHPVADVQGRLHRARGDEEGLDQESFDQDGEDDGGDQQEGQLGEEAATGTPAGRAAGRGTVAVDALHAARLDTDALAQRPTSGDRRVDMPPPSAGQAICLMRSSGYPC
jgi:hypothetical protein